jgi:DNA repair exonuclease SbcCD nuclease subunit
MNDLIIGDLHLDTRNGDTNFLNYQKLFYDNLLKFLKKNTINNVVLLGDIFSNQAVINVNVSNYALSLIEQISKLIKGKIIIIKGNHDKYFRNSYEINSVDVIFKDRFKCFLFDKYYIDGNRLYVNWRDTAEEYIEIFNEIKNKSNIEFIYGHFDMFGYKHNSITINKNESHLKEETFTSKFPNLQKVFSGHYHTPQLHDTIMYLGVPYELSWSECGLNLGFYTLSPENKISFYENDYVMYNYYRFEDQNDINTFSFTPNENYKSFLKFEILNKDIEDQTYIIKENLEKLGHVVTCLHNYSIENDLDFSLDGEINNEDTTDTEKKEGDKLVKFNFLSILNHYIQNKLDHDQLLHSPEEIFNGLEQMYQESQLLINKNNEL